VGARTRPPFRVAAIALAVLGVATTACSSGPDGSSTTSKVPVTATKAPGTTGSRPTASGLQTPDTLPGGDFPSVADPARDGALERVKVRLRTVAEAKEPTALVARPGHPDQLFLAERAGRIRLVTRSANGALTVRPGTLMDLTSLVATDGEKGLLGLAFAPDGDTLYLSYNIANGDSRVDEAPVTGRAGAPRLGSRTNLLKVDQMGTNFHKGGDLAVGADGMLYAGFGDGGPQNDADEHAQNPDLLLGKILRIDPAHPADGRPYGIPADNPYASGGGAPEIYLTGLRNPWRFSFDPESGDLWIGDVGQNSTEEIDRLPDGRFRAGLNLGWSGYEGTEVFEKGRVDGPTVPPLFEISHETGVCSVTGGVVYRGRAIAALDGAYLFADLCRPGVHALRATTPRNGIGRVTDERALDGAEDVGSVISFATDADGEVYLLSLDGEIRRLEPAD
jgi:glucose/arabinose dehydrogenase